jgi:hypothetical protein
VCVYSCELSAIESCSGAQLFALSLEASDEEDFAGGPEGLEDGELRVRDVLCHALTVTAHMLRNYKRLVRGGELRWIADVSESSTAATSKRIRDSPCFIFDATLNTRHFAQR